MRRPSAGSWKPWTPPPLTPRQGPRSLCGCRPRTRESGPEAGAGGGRWPWTARRCGAPAMPAATGRPPTCWRSSTSRPAPSSGRVAVDGKTNEITQFAPLPEPMDLAGAVITADALHTQRVHAKFLVSDKKAHYILVLKKNQPSLYAQARNLPRRNIPAGDRQRDRGHGRGHGREEHRTLKAVTVAAGLAFPHAAQAIRASPRIRPPNR